MERFYPKNFVMWRPTLLLLLMFLEGIYDSTGLFRGVDAAGNYGDSCIQRRGGLSDNCDGMKGFVCDRDRHQCLCDNKFNPKKLVMYYDRKQDLCVSEVGKLCTLPSLKDGLWPIPCVRFAVCEPQPKKKVAQEHFGICRCGQGFVENRDRTCDPQPMISEGYPVISMPQVSSGRIPSEQGMGSGQPRRQPGPGITTDQDNPNGYLERHPDHDESWDKPWEPSSGKSKIEAQRVLSIIVLALSLLL